MIFLIKSEYKESFWRRDDARNVSFFYSLLWPIYVFNSVVNTKLPSEYNKDWLIAILEGHFENVSIQVTWCDTSHVCKVVKSKKTISPSLFGCCRNLQAKKFFFHSDIGHYLETMNYEVRN